MYAAVSCLSSLKALRSSPSLLCNAIWTSSIQNCVLKSFLYKAGLSQVFHHSNANQYKVLPVLPPKYLRMDLHALLTTIMLPNHPQLLSFIPIPLKPSKWFHCHGYPWNTLIADSFLLITGASLKFVTCSQTFINQLTLHQPISVSLCLSACLSSPP